jgi:anthranilate/para-aminobenzoate synthase component II
MIVVIDNYDSFTYNLVQYLGELGAEVHVFRNDDANVSQLEALKPSHIVISPGPGTPAEAGISGEVIRRLGPQLPVLGVCLGHQCIGEVFGGRVTRANRLMHGKTSPVYHNGKDLFLDIPSPLVSAFTQEGELMGIRHRSFPIYGVQFHPESILTAPGKQILRNFLSIGEAVHLKNKQEISIPYS